MKALPAPSPLRAASLWMRIHAVLFGGATVAIVAASLLGAAAAGAETSRPVQVALTAGARIYDDGLNFESRAAFGARLGLGVSDRISVWIDADTSTPTRKISRTKVDVSALRAIVQARLLPGPFCPYVTLGGGSQFYNYENAYDSAMTIFVVGGGVDWHLASRAHLFVESTADLYRARAATYSPTGQVLSASPIQTMANTGLVAGIAVEF